MKTGRRLGAMLMAMILAALAMGCGSTSSGDVKSIKGASGGSDKSAEQQATIEEQVLVDQDGVLITAKEYVTDSIWGDGIKLNIENNTDRNLLIGCSALIVNDFMISDLFGSDIAAGKKANETLYLSSHELKAAGIDTVGKIEVYFHVSDSSTWDRVFDAPGVEIHTSAFDNMDTSADDSGQELYNDGGIRIVGKTVDENSFWGTAILLYTENNSGRNVGIGVDNMSINGYMITPLYSNTIYNGKKAFDDITIFKSDLENNGIEKIQDVELEFRIYDADSYETITETGPIAFSAQ